MIAKFIDMNESILLKKNTTLKNFVDSTFSDHVVCNSTLKYIADSASWASSDLSDGKPGEWCIMDGENGHKYLFISYRQSTKENGITKYMNMISIFDFLDDGSAVFHNAGFGFPSMVSKKDKEKAIRAAMFVRKLMHSPEVLGGKFEAAKKKMDKESKYFHDWD